MELWHNPHLQVAGRAVVIYVFIILAIRLFGKKELAQLSVIDLVFILLISNAVQNAMVGSDTSLTGGLVAASALFLSNYVLKLSIYRSRSWGKFLQGEPVMLIYKGQVKTENLRKVQLSITELKLAAREHGVAHLREVDLAVLEVDGSISILTHDFRQHSRRQRQAVAYQPESNTPSGS